MVGYVDLDEGSDRELRRQARGFISEYYSYIVEDENGDVLVDQVEQYVPAENVYDVVVCAILSCGGNGRPFQPVLALNPAEGSVTLSGLGAGERWTLTVRICDGTRGPHPARHRPRNRQPQWPVHRHVCR